MLISDNEIRRYKYVGEVGVDSKSMMFGMELRVLMPHRRHILLSNKQSFCVQFPYTVCVSQCGYYLPERNDLYYSFYAMAFARSATITLRTPIWVPPLLNFGGFHPTCHPTSIVGRDPFEQQFNGHFGSPFIGSLHPLNKVVLEETFGSLREWSKLSLDEVLEKMVKPSSTIGELYHQYAGGRGRRIKNIKKITLSTIPPRAKFTKRQIKSKLGR